MKRTIFIIVGVAVLVLLLAGAAFMAGQMLSGGLERGNATGPGMIVAPGYGEAGSGEMMVEMMEMPEELPDSAPAAFGLFVRQEDNSIFISEVAGGFLQGKGDSASATEVVITNETTVYKDVTAQDYEDVTAQDFDEPPSGGEAIQMKVQPGSAEEMGEGSFVMVWGDKRGERVVADVLVYSEPMIFTGDIQEYE